MITAERVRELLQIVAAMTPAPWEFRCPHVPPAIPHIIHRDHDEQGGRRTAFVCECNSTTLDNIANAAGIAALRNEFPALGELLLALLEERAARNCDLCGGEGQSVAECTCYEFVGGHQPGCPYHGDATVRELMRKCPECKGLDATAKVDALLEPRP